MMKPLTDMKLPLGVSDFKKLRENKNYYLDKSLFIKEILNGSDNVILLPRPRRFGKTLNLSMLRYFLEQREDNFAHLFNGLAIEQQTEIMPHQGQYPVIFLTFKDCTETTAEQCINQIRRLLTDFYLEYKPILYQELIKEERQYYDKITAEQGHLVDWQNTLKFLMRLLRRQTGKRVMVIPGSAFNKDSTIKRNCGTTEIKRNKRRIRKIRKTEKTFRKIISPKI